MANQIHLAFEHEGNIRGGSVFEVIRETEKAILIKFDQLAATGTGYSPEVWLPKSQLTRHPDKIGPHGVPLSVPAWWVAKNDLYRFL